MNKRIPVDRIRLDGGTQSRAAVDDRSVAQYAEAMQAGAVLPPIVVFHDGVDSWIGDGFHRVHAVRKNGGTMIDADVRTGTRRDAILFSVGANAQHDNAGLRRSNADKRRAVETLLADEEWSRKSDRWIAEKCGVHHVFVGKLRGEPTGDDHQLPREGRDGRVRKTPERLAGATRRIRVSEPANLDDSDVPLDEEIKRVVVEDEDEPPVYAPERKSAGWGSFEMSAAIARSLGRCKDFTRSLASDFASIDPLYRAEFAQRMEGALLAVGNALVEHLPPDGRRAEQNRARFKVLNGGEK